jgi:hypothetical protein
MPILIDTSVLLAFIMENDARHQEAKQALQTLKIQARLITTAIHTELFYMVNARLNYARAIETFRKTRTAFSVITLTEEDFNLMEAIMIRYQDAEFDYADVSLMAVAERLNITQIMTFDRRDFTIYRPRHCAYFDLLP